jgi:hypothetical protein
MTIAGLQAGASFADYENDVKQWEIDRQAWYDKEAKRKERAKRRKQVAGISDWRLLSNDEKLAMSSLSVVEIRSKYPVSERTAYEWIKKSQQLARTK